MDTRIAIFAVCMLLTGSLNTITTKYQVGFAVYGQARAFIVFWSLLARDLNDFLCWNTASVSAPLASCTSCCSSMQDSLWWQDRGRAEYIFPHPAVQSAFMFLGEFLCLIPHFAHKLAVKRHETADGDRFHTSASSSHMAHPHHLLPAKPSAMLGPQPFSIWAFSTRMKSCIIKGHPPDTVHPPPPPPPPPPPACLHVLQSNH